jgi:hypothetical protein
VAAGVANGNSSETVAPPSQVVGIVVASRFTGVLVGGTWPSVAESANHSDRHGNYLRALAYEPLTACGEMQSDSFSLQARV